jgi:transposase
VARPKGTTNPYKLTPEVQAKIVEAVRSSWYLETAAAYAGVSKVSVYAWLRLGNEQKTGIYRVFLNAVEKAMAESEMADLQNISNAAKDCWQASAWRLERRFPRRWGRRKAIEEDEELAVLQKQIAQLQAEKLRAEIARLNGGGEVPDEEDGFLEALEAKAQEVWHEGNDGDDGEDHGGEPA